MKISLLTPVFINTCFYNLNNNENKSIKPCFYQHLFLNNNVNKY